MGDSHAPTEPCCGACESGVLRASGAMPASDRGAALVIPPSRRLVLTWRDADGEHQHALDASGTATIGRGKSCTVVLASSKVSRVQCTLHFSPDGVDLEDAGSSCGTFVNGERITRAPLRQHDRVFIGDSVFLLRVE